MFRSSSDFYALAFSLRGEAPSRSPKCLVSTFCAEYVSLSFCKLLFREVLFKAFAPNKFWLGEDLVLNEPGTKQIWEFLRDSMAVYMYALKTAEFES